MDHDDNGRANLRDVPVYSWHNKQEGKEDNAKQLRYLLDPAAVTRRLGDAPAVNPPANEKLRVTPEQNRQGFRRSPQQTRTLFRLFCPSPPHYR